MGPIRKLAAIAEISEELERPPELASAVVGRILNDATAKALDVAAFGAQAADGITPAGLTHGLTPITAATAGVGAMAADLSALAGAIAGANIDASNLIFVAPAKQAMAIKIAASLKFDNLVLTTFGPAGWNRGGFRSGCGFQRL